MTCTGGRLAAFPTMDDEPPVPRDVHRSSARQRSMPNDDLRRGQLLGRYVARSCAPLIWHFRSCAANYIRCHVRGRHSMLEPARSIAGPTTIANLAWRCNGDRLHCNRHEPRWFVSAVLTKIADEQCGAPQRRKRFLYTATSTDAAR
ncbi:hypothetical protein Poly59_30590 [Rubripirellula reticaptiva]|uniref:Uncharacterized protein n=1 Tax=Rubripirellula reticaptiva TaxID=2528013 RepID=A0A5C6ETQ5_9BACT|nr:hypothetical protein Poly59_30590 [Rubripirellula reticaptiva]